MTQEERLKCCYDVASKCFNLNDMTAGTDYEQEFLTYLLSVIDHPLLEYHLQPIDVITWRDRYTVIEANGEAFRALSLPITTGGVVEGRLVSDMNRCSNAIYITYLPSSVRDAKLIYIDAVRKGALGVIFVEPTLDVMRRVVITSEQNYTWHSAKAPRVPAVAVSYSVGRKLFSRVGQEVKIVSDVDVRPGIGYNLEVELKQGRDYVVLTAHHDHWLSGAHDNCLGVGLLVQLFKDYLSSDVIKRGSRGIKIVLLTAKEVGNPRFSSLYWSYGSRLYVMYLKHRDIIDTHHIVMNVDVIGREIKVYTSWDVRVQIRDVVNSAGLADYAFSDPVPYFDSMCFEAEGVPAITISSIDRCWDIYHSTGDLISSSSSCSVLRAIQTVDALVRHFMKNDLDYSVLVKHMLDELSKLGISIALKASPRCYRALRSTLSKYLVQHFDDKIDVKYVDNVLTYMLELKSRPREAPRRVEVLGTGEVLLDLDASDDHIEFHVDNVLRGLTQEILYRLRDAL